MTGETVDLLAALKRSLESAKRSAREREHEEQDANVNDFDPTYDLEDDESQECGVSYDHDTLTTYEDDTILQWICTRCGGEGYEEKEL